MNIYLDLDETLVHSVSYYEININPLAKRIIKDCRKMAQEVNVLTIGTHEYAKRVIEYAGFKIDKIIGRDDFLTYLNDFETTTVEKNIDPTSVLIDNTIYSDGLTELKMLYLGIEKDQVYKIQSFYTNNEKEYGERLQEWQNIKKCINRTL